MKLGPFILLLILLISCEKKISGSDEASLFNDIVYSDSFSPISYEYPLSRKIILYEDVDIGILILPESTSPELRAIYSFIDNFLKMLFDASSVKSFFSDPAYNSYRLRYSKPPKKKSYNLRVSRLNATGNNIVSISFKVMTKKGNAICIVELTKNEEEFIITDFEYKGFDELFSM